MDSTYHVENTHHPVKIYDIELVSEYSKCKETEVYQGKLNKQDCASCCNAISSVMFHMSRQDSGYCEGRTCMCYCYPEKFQNGACETMHSGNDDLYRYVTGTKDIILKSFISSELPDIKVTIFISDSH